MLQMINGLTLEDRSIQTLARYVPQRTSTREAALEAADKVHSTPRVARASAQFTVKVIF